MKRACSLFAIAIAIAISLSKPYPALAQTGPAPAPGPPSPSPSASATPPVSPPPAPSEVPPAAVSPVAPATAAPTATADSWSQVIDKSRSQEATTYEDVREKREDLATRAAFEAGPQRLRQRLRFFVGLGAGLQNYTQLRYDYDATYGPNESSTIEHVAFAAQGPLLQAGVGVRGTIAQHFDLQTRLGLSIAKTQGSMFVNGSTTEPSSSYTSTSYDNFDVESSSTFLGVELEGTIRWLPQLFGPRFFVGLGPMVELTSVTASPEEGSSGLPPLTVNETNVAAYGLLELGVIFGGEEQWEIALRGGAGVSSQKDAELVMLGVARAF
jgi:hypothetical protein